MTTNASVESPEVIKLCDKNTESQAELAAIRSQFTQVQATFQKVLIFSYLIYIFFHYFKLR